MVKISPRRSVGLMMDSKMTAGGKAKDLVSVVLVVVR